MAITLGKKISDLRKEKGFTQEELAEQLNVSPQAVSKWENDISCPDIMLLPKIAQIFGISVDELLSGREKEEMKLLPEEQRKSLDELVFRVRVNSADGDKVRVNIPMSLVKMGLDMGMNMPQVTGNDVLKGIDFSKLIELAERGMIGKLVEVESAEGDVVEIVVE